MIRYFTELSVLLTRFREHSEILPRGSLESLVLSIVNFRRLRNTLQQAFTRLERTNVTLRYRPIMIMGGLQDGNESLWGHIKKI